MKNKKYRFLVVVLVLFSMVGIQVPQVFAGSATLTWVAPTTNNDNTPLTDLAGYKIYYGTSQRTGTDPKSCVMCGYATKIDVGNVTSYAFNNLTDGQTYYFSVSAYDTSNNESSFSGEVSKIIPSTNITNITFSAKIEGLSIPANKSFTIKILNATTDALVNQSSATTDNNGNLIFSNIPIAPGTYHVIVSSVNYLSKKMLNINLTSDNTTPIILSKLLAGDLDNDNAISAGDWGLMSPFFGTNNALADIDDNGLVNSLDFGLMNKNWGQAGD